MRKHWLVPTLVAGSVFIAGAMAHGATNVKWPANCRNAPNVSKVLLCMDDHLTNLHQRVATNAEQIKGLTRQVASLSTDVNKTKSDLNAAKGQITTLQTDLTAAVGRITALEGFAACVSFVAPVTQYGENPTGGTFGYVWKNPDASQFLTTALDFTLSGDTVHAFVVVADPSCVARGPAEGKFQIKRPGEGPVPRPTG